MSNGVRGYASQPSNAQVPSSNCARREREENEEKGERLRCLKVSYETE